MQIKPHNPKKVEPALLTASEYIALVNPDGKWHDSSAYDFKLGDSGYIKRGNMKLLRRFKRNGVTFELRVKAEKNEYVLRDEEGEIVRKDGMALTMSDEEIAASGRAPTEYTFAIFAPAMEGDQCIAAAQDEWGCVLIHCAREYRGFGLGVMLGKLYREVYPDKPSGGFTNAGQENFRKVHRAYVVKALRNGFYSEQVRTGKLTADRAREIISSVGLEHRKKHEELDLAPRANTIVTFADGFGTFILYDTKFIKYRLEKIHQHFIDKLVLGGIYVAVNGEFGRIKVVNAVDKVKPLLFSMAYDYCVREDATLWVEEEDYEVCGLELGEESVAAGYKSRPVIGGERINGELLSHKEKMFREPQDPYEELRSTLYEYL